MTLLYIAMSICQTNSLHFNLCSEKCFIGVWLQIQIRTQTISDTSKDICINSFHISKGESHNELKGFETYFSKAVYFSLQNSTPIISDENSIFSVFFEMSLTTSLFRKATAERYVFKSIGKIRNVLS